MIGILDIMVLPNTIQQHLRMPNVDQYILILSGILSYIFKSLAVYFQELEQLDEFLLKDFYYCFWKAI